MIYLLLYDISEDKIRTKISKLLTAEGFERIQYSVYTALSDPKKNNLLWQKMTKLLAAEPTAKLYVFPVTKNNFRSMQIIGNFDHDIDYLTGDKCSLTF